MSEPISGFEAHASWLTGKQMGRDEEQQRIIKLLEACPKDEKWHLDNLMTCEGRCDFAIQYYQDSLIALIKGATK